MKKLNQLQLMKKGNCLTSNVKTKLKVKVTQSDHNSIITKFSIKWERKTKSKETKLFNLKNIVGQTKFTEHAFKPGILSNIFEGDNVDIEKATKKFIKKLNGSMHQCFQEVRVKKILHTGDTESLDRCR